MILLCGGEGAAGSRAGGVFFLLVSYAGPGRRDVEDAARRRVRSGLTPFDRARLRRRGPAVAARVAEHELPAQRSV